MTTIFSAIPASAAPMVDEDYLAAFEDERSRTLRRRVAWYCIIAIVGIFLSAAWNTWDLFASRNVDEGARQSTALDLAGDCALLVLYGAALLTLNLRKMGRRSIVTLLSWLTVLVSTVAVVVTPLANSLDMSGEHEQYGPEHFTLITGVTGLLAVTLLNTVGSLLIALSPKELLRQFMPTWLVYSLVMLLLHDSSPSVRILLIVAFPIAGLPGMGWSLWRYRRFGEAFHSRIMNERYGELAHELAYARRLHESLFPPPIDRGPIRVAYRYAPMREIGGDFLFIHPAHALTSESSIPLTVTIIDVSGHGIPAALAVNRLHGELQRFFSANPAGTPGQLIADLNRYAYVALAPQGVFATAVCISADQHRRVVRWSSAGHPAAFLRAEGRQVRELCPTTTMLGVLEPEAFQAEERSAPFEPSDRILAFTDGAFEARDAHKREFGMERLRDIAAAPTAPGAGIGRLANTAMDAVSRHRRGRVTDDVLIVEIASVDAISGADLMLSVRSMNPLADTSAADSSRPV